YTGPEPASIADVKSVYALNESGLTYDTVTLSLPKLGMTPDHILHCRGWNFSSGTCREGAWQINSTEDYDARENSTHVFFNASTFDAVALASSIGLDVSFEEPRNDTVVPHLKNFTVNASVTCRGGDCGEVNALARYNSTGKDPGTAIPTQDGATPLRSFDPNPTNCTLARGETCTVTWTVNASGTLGSHHTLDVKFNVSGTSVSNQTENRTIEIGNVVLFNLTYETVDFGLLNPGESGAANGNDNLLYNISVAENSNGVDDLWMRGEPLVGQSNDRYQIGPSNLSWSFSNSESTGTPLSSTYQHVTSTIPAGTNKTMYYWADVPYGIRTQQYTGTIYFKANSTG
ncbi:MAG: hypothetical protein SVS85_03300, partial [Candidatus Nanohaloarchaea archaeon]|nr:hypothetical protein [Candidatus Nanohaloarchaea archaeon]